MHRRKLARLVPGLLLLAVATVFIACGGNGLPLPAQQADPAESQRNLPQMAEPQQQGTQLPDESAVPEAALNRVILEVPALGELSAGDEFSAVISAEFGEEVHQGVLRLLYDAGSMSPLEISPGTMLPGDMIRIADLDNSGFLPLAFTALPGGNDIGSGSGELYRVRFRLLVDGAAADRIRFRSDREFLQLRNRDGRHIRFDVETRAGGRDAQ